MQEITLQFCIAELIRAMPIWEIAVLLFATWVIAASFESWRWRRSVKKYLPSMHRELLDKQEREMAKLRAEKEALEEERGRLLALVRGAEVMNKKVGEILGQQANPEAYWQPGAISGKARKK